MKAGVAPGCSSREYGSAFNRDTTWPTSLGSTGFDLTSTMMSDARPLGARISQTASILRLASRGDRASTFSARSSRRHRGGRRAPIARAAVAIRCVSDIQLFRSM